MVCFYYIFQYDALLCLIDLKKHFLVKFLYIIPYHLKPHTHYNILGEIMIIPPRISPQDASMIYHQVLIIP